jgi:hypothetical protein
MMVSKNWCELDIDTDNLDLYTNKHDDCNLVFAHHDKDDEIYPLTIIEIAEAQRKDQELKVYYKKNAQMPHKNICFHLIEDPKVLCKIYHSSISKAQGSQMVSPLPPTPWALPSRRDDEIRDVLERYAYYHPEIRKNLQILPSQVKKEHSQKYGHLPPNLVITTPWKVLCEDLIGPYTLKWHDSSNIDFMCLTMIGPTISWFEIVELPTVDLVMTVPPVGKGKKVTSSKNTTVAEPYVDKSSA